MNVQVFSLHRIIDVFSMYGKHEVFITTVISACKHFEFVRNFISYIVSVHNNEGARKSSRLNEKTVAKIIRQD